jgi:hypothetical protein
MAKQLFVRTASAAGLVALALFFLGVDPFLSAGAVFNNGAPISVDRSLKGDRLPVADPAIAYAPDWQNEFGAVPRAQPTAQMPFGCDAAFSTITAASASNIYRRCMS